MDIDFDFDSPEVEEVIKVSVVESTDLEGNSLFLAMADDTTSIIGRGDTPEGAVMHLQEQLADLDEYDLEHFHMEFAS